MALRNPRIKITPPDKGSFPLDHENICKELMLKYITCLSSNDNKITPCRQEVKNYLDCRMKNELMAQEPWSRLGFPENEGK